MESPFSAGRRDVDEEGGEGDAASFVSVNRWCRWGRRMTVNGGGLPVTSALFYNDSVQININYVFTNSNFMYVWNIYINL